MIYDSNNYKTPNILFIGMVSPIDNLENNVQRHKKDRVFDFVMDWMVRQKHVQQDAALNTLGKKKSQVNT